MAKKKLEDALKNGVESRLKKAANIVTSSDALRQELEEATQTEKKTVRQKSTAERTAEIKQKRAAEIRQKMKRTGRTGRQEKKARVELRVTEEVKKDVEDLALLNDMSVTEYLVSLVAEDRRRNRSALNDLRTI